jgi:hypothetical protein
MELKEIMKRVIVFILNYEFQQHCEKARLNWNFFCFKGISGKTYIRDIFEIPIVRKAGICIQLVLLHLSLYLKRLSIEAVDSYHFRKLWILQ